VRKLFVLLKSS